MSRKHRYNFSRYQPAPSPLVGGDYLVPSFINPAQHVFYGQAGSYKQGPFSVDGGHTWFDPNTGSQVLPTSPMRTCIDMYGRIVQVPNQPTFTPAYQQPSPVYHAQVQNTQPSPAYRQVPPPVYHAQVQNTQPSPAYRQVPQYSQPQQNTYAPVTVSRNPPVQTITQPTNQAPQQKSNIHPSIVETGEKDPFSGSELILFKGVKCYPPKGERRYTFNKSCTEVTLTVIGKNGSIWVSETYNI